MTEDAIGDYETVRGPEIQNYLWDSHSSSDEKIGKFFERGGESKCFYSSDEVYKIF